MLNISGEVKNNAQALEILKNLAGKKLISGNFSLELNSPNFFAK